MFVYKIGVISAVIVLMIGSTFAAGKPLKIFIMAGQSNMQGKAKVSTIERLPLAGGDKQLYEDMKVKDGLPSAVKDVYGVYFSGDDMTKGKSSPLSVSQGPLPGYGETLSPSTSFGPDYTFSIYMQKHLNEPILIIKTAWGGRDLRQQFRPPSAGPHENEKDRHGNPSGHYYSLIIKRVREVLADPGKYHPAYKAEDGYEIAGFVWFQGYNDLISNSYPSESEKSPRDYSEYTRLMACFIRDVRKDLKVPQMPFLIGVMGIGGPSEDTKDNQYHFRKAQEAPASLPEFQGNVVAVRTENCWDMEMAKIEKKVFEAAKAEVLAAEPGKGGLALSRAADKLVKSVAPKVLTPEELSIFSVGSSNAAFHYMGSAYTYGNIGKVMAEGMSKMVK